METTITTIRLRVSNGEMRCHQVRPRAPGKFPAVIVLMEVFGLNDHIKDVAELIAQEGYVAIAPDLYYRQSLNVVGYDQLPMAISLAQQLEHDGAIADLRSVISHLKSQQFVDGDRIGIIGFCLGGTIAFLAACKLSTEIKADVSFYGGGIAADGPTGPLNVTSELQGPILCFFGGNDPYITSTEVMMIEGTLQSLGKIYEVKVYPDADHGFFCEERESYYVEAAADAWERTKGWFERYLKG